MTIPNIRLLSEPRYGSFARIAPQRITPHSWAIESGAKCRHRAKTICKNEIELSEFESGFVAMANHPDGR